VCVCVCVCVCVIVYIKEYTISIQEKTRLFLLT